MSRISLIRLSRCWLDRLIFLRHSATRTRSSSRVDAIAAIPMIAFIGVRISWLMLERNWLLAMLAALAPSNALCSAWRFCSSS